MTQGNLAQKLPEIESNEELGKDASEKVDRTLTEELVLGVCFPIGSAKNELIDTLKIILKETYNYEVKVIKLSDYIKKHGTLKHSEVSGQTKGFSILKNKIDNGNELRGKYNNAILAELAIRDINIERRKGKNGDEDLIPIEELKSRRICYIIDSLKNDAELNLFRKVYRDIFYFLK